jgi:creatinine amidohydrolase
MRFGEMHAPTLRELDRDAVVVLAPIAACEQHGPHLPTLTDTILVTGVAEAVERLLPESVLLLPTLWLGASHHHLPLGATLSLSADTHVSVLCELLQTMLDEGFTRLLLLNGHGGNIDPMHVALRLLQPTYRDRLLAAACYWDLADSDLRELCEGPYRGIGHACEIETSLMLALRPELVRMDLRQDDVRTLPPEMQGLYVAEDLEQTTHDGVIGCPSYASAEKGQRMLEATSRRIAATIRTILQITLPLRRE